MNALGWKHLIELTTFFRVQLDRTSDKEYSSEEERRPNRSQHRRRAHDMSSSSAEEDEAGDTNNSETEDEADSAEELVAKVSTQVQNLDPR